MLKTTVEQYKHMKTGKKKDEHGVADLVIIDNNKTMYKKCIYFFRNMNDGKIVNFKIVALLQPLEFKRI